MLEYYSIDNKLTVYYIDITLPAYIQKDYFFIVDLKIDFWIMPDREKFIILDQNELDDAIRLNLFKENEIISCKKTTNHILNLLKSKKFGEITSDYEFGNYKDWERYRDFF